MTAPHSKNASTGRRHWWNEFSPEVALLAVFVAGMLIDVQLLAYPVGMALTAPGWSMAGIAVIASLVITGSGILGGLGLCRVGLGRAGLVVSIVALTFEVLLLCSACGMAIVIPYLPAADSTPGLILVIYPMLATALLLLAPTLAANIVLVTRPCPVESGSPGPSSEKGSGPTRSSFGQE